MLTIKNLSLSYGEKEILKNINIDIPKGEIYTLIGPSGCGKSSLLKAIASINQISSGSISLSNEDLSPSRHIIGYIAQDYGLLKWKTVYENIILSAVIKKIDYKDKINQIIDELGIENLLDAYPSMLSGGEKQRVAIARALLIEPDVLLMDEPFSSLDDYNKESAINLFLDIWKKHKVTCLIVTHDYESALYLGKKIIVMDKLANIKMIKENNLFGKVHTEDIGLYKSSIESFKSLRSGGDNL